MFNKIQNWIQRVHSRGYFSILLNGIWALPAVLIMRLISPMLLIRVGTLNSGRIGHFVTDGAEQIARLSLQPRSRTVDIFWFWSETSNRQWERMLRRTLTVRGWAKHLDAWNSKFLPGGAKHARPSTQTNSRDVEGLYIRYDVRIPFTPSEDEVATKWLRSKGWVDGDPFVCLHVRDNAYLANNRLHGKGDSNSYKEWSYHAYRDSDVLTYIQAIEWLTSQGVWVIRMGRLMTDPLPKDMNKVIDYAFDQTQSDLLDIWLFANCTGCISTSSGPDAISHVYRKPILFVNALPLGGFASFAHAIWVPKNLVWRNTGFQLSVEEYFENSYYRLDEYETAGINIVDLTPDELEAAVREFWQRHIGVWVPSSGDIARQNIFWEICRSWSQSSVFHGWQHPEARIGANWLRHQVFSRPQLYG